PNPREVRTSGQNQARKEGRLIADALIPADKEKRWELGESAWHLLAPLYDVTAAGAVRVAVQRRGSPGAHAPPLQGPASSSRPIACWAMEGAGKSSPAPVAARLSLPHTSRAARKCARASSTAPDSRASTPRSTHTSAARRISSAGPPRGPSSSNCR